MICYKLMTTKSGAWTLSDGSDKMRSHIATMFCPRGLDKPLTPWVLELSETSDTQKIFLLSEFVPEIWQTNACSGSVIGLTHMM